jgi:hypothetical protein
MIKNLVIRFAALSAIMTLSIGCSSKPKLGDYVARVGTSILTKAEIERSLINQTAFLDSTDAVSQIVERWVTNELLYQEALNQGLKTNPDVQRLLADNERSVLISTLVNKMTTEDLEGGPGDDAIRTYYEQNRDQLALREPYIQIRHLVFSSPDSAAIFRKAVSEMGTDALGKANFARLAATYGRDGPNPETYYPQSQLFSAIPGLLKAFSELSPGQTLPVVNDSGRYHVFQLIRRLETGVVPAMELIIEDLRAKVSIQLRKQLYGRQVQQLRTRAMARDELEVK